MGPWPTLAKWSSLAQCFGGPGQHWHNGHHWHSVLVVMVNTDTMVIIGTVFWWSWTSLAQWTSLTQCFGCHGHHWHSVWWPWSTLAQWSSLAQCFGCHGQHWHNGHHWHSVLVVMDIIGTVDIIDTVFWLSWTSLAQCLVAMVNIGTMVIIGTVVNIGTVDIIGTVFWWPWSTLAQWFRGTKHWCFLWCWPAQALKQSVELHPMKFYIEGRGNQVHSPHNDAVWISYSFVVNLKNLLNKQPNCSRFTTKAVFWKGY